MGYEIVKESKVAAPILLGPLESLSGAEDGGEWSVDVNVRSEKFRLARDAIAAVQRLASPTSRSEGSMQDKTPTKATTTMQTDTGFLQ